MKDFFSSLLLPRSGAAQAWAAGRVVLWAVVFSSFLCAASAPAANAQDRARPLPLDPQVQLSQYMHRVWETEHGLPQNSVLSVAQTQDGYLWLGTQKGLVRFDGVRFSGSPALDSSGAQAGEVRALLEARDGALWVGTLGHGAIRISEGKATSFTTTEGLPSDEVLDLYEDRAGTVWLGTAGGLARYDSTEGFAQVNAQGALSKRVILSIAEDAEGRLWVGTDAGVARLDNGKSEATLFGPEEGLTGGYVRALDVDAEGTLWAGTDQGVAAFRDGQFEACAAQKALCSRAVSALLSGPRGALWIGTLGGGLFRLYEGQFDAFSARDGLSHDRVRALAFDQEGSLWIGTEMGGLNRLSSGKFVPISMQQGLSNNVVSSVLEGRDSTLWVGTDGGGLNRIADGRVEQFTTADGLTNNSVSSLHEDRQGRLWAGTFSSGLCRLRSNLDEDRFTCLTTADGLLSDNVFSISESSEGDLWVGTDRGLSRLRGDTFTQYTDQNGLARGRVTSLLEDASGDLWIGTYGGGLSRFRNGRFTTYAEGAGLSGDVLPLHEDQNGTLWVGTNGEGLCRRRGDRFQCFTTADGLRSNTVIQILEDDQGYLWLGSLEGISRVKKSALKAYAAGALEKLAPTAYGTTDGLRSREMNGGTQPAAWKGQDGRLYFATIEGVAVIDPSRIPVNTLPPPVRVEQLHAGGAAVPLDGALSLPPGQRDVEIRYTGLSFVAPEHVQFQYKLEGYDQHWIDAGTRRSAYYTNLPPGDDYRFRARAANSDGVWNEKGASLAFSVQPFFYETPWFFLLCALAVGAVGIGAFQLRTRRLRVRERKLEQRVADQTVELRERKQALEQLNTGLEQEVQTQLTQKLQERKRYEKELIDAKERAEESARLKSAILANMSHEIRTPISSILGFAQILGEELEEPHHEFANYIQQNGQRLMDTITSILDLAKVESDSFNVAHSAFDLRTAVREEAQLLKPLADKKNLALRTELPEQAVPVHLDRSALARILHNLVGNAIKFTEKGEVTIAVDADGAAASLCVRDTGIGIGGAFLPELFTEFKQESNGLARSHEGTGLGLSITKRLVEAMEGTIRVESERGCGTAFTVEFALSELGPSESGATPKASRTPRRLVGSTNGHPSLP